MGIYEYAKQTLLADKKYSIYYVISISILTIFVFNAVNITLNSSIMNTKESVSVVGMLSNGFTYIYDASLLQMERLLILIIVEIFFASMCNYYFTRRRTKELAYAFVNGASLNDLFRFLLFQNASIFIFSSFIGIILGFILLPLFNIGVYSLLGVSANIFEFNMSSIYITFMIILVQCAYFIVYNFGYIYRREVIDLFKETHTVKKEDRRIIKIPGLLFFLFYFVPFIYIIFAREFKEIELSYAAFTIISVFATIGIIKYGMPALMGIIKKSKGMYNNLSLIYISNFVDSLSKSIIYFLSLSLSYWYFSYDMMEFKNVQGIPEIDLFILLSIFVIVSFSLIYKLLCEFEDKMASYKILINLSYTKDEIKNIISKEILLFFILGLSLPIGIILITLFGFAKVGAFTLGTTILMIITLFAPLLISSIMCNILYRKNIIKFLKTPN
ncbi:MAG: FtsX-like permease family protein [Clostridium sp.]